MNISSSFSFKFLDKTLLSSYNIVNSYYFSFKIPVIIIRSNNIYGKKQFTEKVIPKFITQILNNEIINIQGDGTNKRSFLYIDDLIEAVELILLKGKIGNIYNQ